MFCIYNQPTEHKTSLWGLNEREMIEIPLKNYISIMKMIMSAVIRQIGWNKHCIQYINYVYIFIRTYIYFLM